MVAGAGGVARVGELDARPGQAFDVVNPLRGGGLGGEATVLAVGGEGASGGRRAGLRSKSSPH